MCWTLRTTSGGKPDRDHQTGGDEPPRKVMGYSRDTFYRYRQAVEDGGVDALLDRSRRKPNFRNRTAPEIEEAIVALAIDQPALGQVRVSNELRKRGLLISPGRRTVIYITSGTRH